MTDIADNCWRIQGSWSGSQSCDKLVLYSHCRHCPVYLQAAHQLHDSLAKDVEPKHKEGVGQARAYIVFRLSHDWYALDPADVVTVIPNSKFRDVPGKSNEVLHGLVAFEGEFIVLFSLSTLLHKQRDRKQSPDVFRGVYQRIVVISVNDKLYGFYVDEVRGSLDITIQRKTEDTRLGVMVSVTNETVCEFQYCHILDKQQIVDALMGTLA